MKLGTMTASAALVVAAMLGGEVTPVEAGNKGKRAHHQSGQVHISPNVSNKNLKALQRQLEHKGKRTKTEHNVGRAIEKELDNRRVVDDTATIILNSRDPITGLLDIGTGIGGKRKRGH